jgi:hypothetical protein
MTKITRYFSSLNITTRSKQSPNRRKFAQFGRTVSQSDFLDCCMHTKHRISAEKFSTVKIKADSETRNRPMVPIKIDTFDSDIFSAVKMFDISAIFSTF